MAKTIYFFELSIINSATAHYLLYIYSTISFSFLAQLRGSPRWKQFQSTFLCLYFAPSVPFHFLADDDIRGYSPSVVGVWPSPLSSRPQTMASLRGLSCVRSVGGSLRTLKTISSLSACFTVGHLWKKGNWFFPMLIVWKDIFHTEFAPFVQ